VQELRAVFVFAGIDCREGVKPQAVIQIEAALSVRSIALVGLLFLGCWCVRADEDTLEKLKEKPITTAQGKVGELLRQWWKEGTAAGNVGDFYDNRDGSHSDLNLGPYPQLQKIVYTPEDIKLRKHWAAQRVLLPHVVFGNSSTSAPPTTGGSNPRQYYTSTGGLAFLYKQYTGNNVYIYPEHRDHDPGHNGKNDGYGDLYPTNTPYLFISQGSSGSDQPFMRAIPFTLAALRPEVKKKLTEAGLLMPTLQMIFRSTVKNLKDPDDYLTAKAHPSVFEGSNVNDLAMVHKAHDLQLDNLPPMIQLKVLEEDQPIPGVDFFDIHATEKLADTPAVIARIFRGKQFQRRMLVSAADSYDLNKKPLTFTWVVLRGDPERIKIVPRGKDQAEIFVSYHERRPIAPGSAMESNRVDIGVFAHNGTYHSAPGFITWFALDSEARKYDDKGRIQEISFQPNFVDQRLSARREWRDVYHYAPQGSLLGWERFLGKETFHFSPEGLLVLEKDDAGRAIRARTVSYVQDPPKMFGLNSNPLRQVSGDTVFTFEYDGPDDFKGKVKSKEKAP
jgi:hypothetical protein